jgi:hypothetical protein
MRIAQQHGNDRAQKPAKDANFRPESCPWITSRQDFAPTMSLRPGSWFLGWPLPFSRRVPAARLRFEGAAEC